MKFDETPNNNLDIHKKKTNTRPNLRRKDLKTRSNE